MYYANSDVRLEEMPVPQVGPGEILMRVEASGVCGSDVMEWYRVGRIPLVLGHEVAGTVAETGKGVRRFKKGDRIAAAHHVPCMKCRYCKSGHETVCEMLRKTNFHPGGFAEYIRLPAVNVERGVLALPNSVSFEDATFIEPLACVARGQRLAGLKKGDTVLIAGSGMSGVLHAALAKARAAKRVITTDVIEYRRKFAERCGADEAMDARGDVPARVRAASDGLGADIVIVTTGAPKAIEQALASVRRGGTVLFFAATEKGVTIPLSINDTFWRTELTLMSSYAGSPADHKEALGLIKAGKVRVSDMITHRFGLAQSGDAFRFVSEAKDSMKVIIEPQK